MNKSRVAGTVLLISLVLLLVIFFKHIDADFFILRNDFDSVVFEIKKSQELIQLNQQKINESILKLDIRITKLLKVTEEGNKVLHDQYVLFSKRNIAEIKKLKTLVKESLNKMALEKRIHAQHENSRTVETDYSKQQLLKKGWELYKWNDFTASIKIYKKVLDIDPSNTESLIFYNASLYYQNPGDESNFSGIKKDLVPLIEDKKLTGDEERTALKVLIGISREEGDSTSLKRYQDALKQLEVNN